MGVWFSGETLAATRVSGGRTISPFDNSISTGEALSVIGTNTAAPDSARSRAAFSATIDSGMPSLSPPPQIRLLTS